MIKTVTSAQMPVNEQFLIQKQVIRHGKSKKRICIVSGTHGDELEGQYVCWDLIRRVNEQIENLDGILEVYPALNPLGVNSMTRGIPQFDLDMNRIFPGNENGTFAEYTAAKIIEDISGADVVIDIHASNIFLREIPQVRINEISQDVLVPLAKFVNTDFIWVHSSVTVMEATLSHSLNKAGTPTLVAEMGAGMRITKSYGDQLLDGIFNLMSKMGIWSGEVKKVSHPIVSTDGNVSIVYSDASGIYIPAIKHWAGITKGDHIGDILNPLTGTVEQQIFAPCSGIVFTLREYPVVYEGSLLVRILGGC